MSGLRVLLLGAPEHPAALTIGRIIESDNAISEIGTKRFKFIRPL